jgi:hypothetical protein
MNHQIADAILRLRPAPLTSPPEFTTNEDRVMNSQFAATFDLNSDIYEIGLIAAASPDFTDALIRALTAAGEDTRGSKEPGNTASSAHAA